MVPDIQVTLWQHLAPLLLGAALSWLVTSKALSWGSYTEAEETSFPFHTLLW